MFTANMENQNSKEDDSLRYLLSITIGCFYVSICVVWILI